VEEALTVDGAKLQIKAGVSVALLHLPPGVTIELPEGCMTTSDPGGAGAVVVFVTNQAELSERAEPAVGAALRDAVAWVAYPKGGQLGTDLSRDSLRDLLAVRGIDAVRQVSIDGIWSALRFRPAAAR
jgi:hypothetical protein